MLIHQNVLTLDVSVDDAEGMHILENACHIKGNSEPLRKRQLDFACASLFHMKQVEKASLFHVLENNHDVRDLRYHAHEQCYVGVSKDALHHDFILNFGKQLICQPWVEDFLDCYRRAIQEAFMDH